MSHFKNKSLALLTVMATLSFGTLAFVPTAIAAPATFIVNVTTDAVDANPGDGVCETATTGECSLRAAMEESNANVGADTIEFEIPGTPGQVHAITPATPYPYLTDEVHVNGYTQDGAVANTAVSPAPINSVIKIEVDGSVAATNQSAAFGFMPGSAGSSLSGLSIYDFSTLDSGQTSGVNIAILESNISITGSYVGVKSDGLTPGSGGNHSSISMISMDSNNLINNVSIGGDQPADRNVIYGLSTSNVAAAIFGGADNSVIYGNYVGIGKDGLTDLTPGSADTAGVNGPYSIGLNTVQQGAMQIGGPGEGQGNLFSGGTVGVVLSSNGHKVQGNYFGTDHTGQANDNITNGIGMTATAGSENIVGGTNPGEGNVFKGLSGAGILVSAFVIQNIDGNGTTYPINPEAIAIIGNSISDIKVFNFTTALETFGNMNQGIDLAEFQDTTVPGNFVPDTITLRGPTPNDNGDSDVGANSLMNYPVLNSSQQVSTNLNVNFDLDAIGSPNDQYRVEFFANDESTIFGAGPGQTFLGSTIVGAGSNIDATIAVGSLDLVGKSLSATATPVDGTKLFGFGGTSEFSYNILIGSGTDFDADTIADTTEDLAVNGGDGNDDGIDDKFQPTVSSYSVGNVPVTFETDGCSSNGSVSLLAESTLEDNDQGFSYPYGLTDFSLNCSRGSSVNVTKYVFDDTNDELASYSVRKYRPNTHTFEAVNGSTVVRETVGSEEALVMSYSIQDGGPLDDDGLENGVIVDPVGLAVVLTSSTTANNNNGSGNAAGKTTASGVLSATGARNVNTQTGYSLVMLIAGFGIVLLTKRRKEHQIA